jgi:hypothetical protein
MADVSIKTLREMQHEARKYLISVKGNKLSEIELIYAENLMVFGYKKAMEDLGWKQNKTKTSKENYILANQGDN